MSSSMKYLGAATDPGEWWCDRGSEADDLGPGVSFTVRCGEDGGNGPHVTCCYGLRQDVRLDRVQAEAERILEEYQRPDRRHPDGRKLQGPLRPIQVEKWRTLEDVMKRLPGAMVGYKKINIDPEIQVRRFGKVSPDQMIWKLEDMVESVTGSPTMCARVVELVGMAALQKMYDALEAA